MGSHRTYTTVGAGDKCGYEKPNKAAGWLGQSPRKGTKSKKKLGHCEWRRIPVGE